MNLVSIVMPYYNKRNYMAQSINSILDQTYQNFEIIIVYDDVKKTDINFIKNISEIDKRIKVIILAKIFSAYFGKNLFKI